MNKLIKFAVLTLFFTFMCHTQYILVLSSFRVNFKHFFLFLILANGYPPLKLEKNQNLLI
jgi:hypothetical protein